jgi:hypothetical protein
MSTPLAELLSRAVSMEVAREGAHEFKRGLALLRYKDEVGMTLALMSSNPRSEIS